MYIQSGASKGKPDNRAKVFITDTNPIHCNADWIDSRQNWQLLSRAVICYGVGGNFPPRPQFAPSPQLKFNFFRNLVKSKISLHNSSIHRNWSVFFTIFLPLWYYLAHFLVFKGKIGSNFAPSPQDFDEIMP